MTVVPSKADGKSDSWCHDFLINLRIGGWAMRGGSMDHNGYVNTTTEIQPTAESKTAVMLHN